MKPEHGDVPEDDFAVGGGRAGRDERGAVILLRGHWRGAIELLDTGRHGRERRFERVEFLPDVERGDVDEIDLAAVELRAAVGRAIRDALHFLQEFLVELAEKERVGQRANRAPALDGVFGVALAAERCHVIRDLRRE